MRIERPGPCFHRACLARAVIERRLGLTMPVLFGPALYRGGPEPGHAVALCDYSRRAQPLPAGELGKDGVDDIGQR